MVQAILSSENQISRQSQARLPAPAATRWGVTLFPAVVILGFCTVLFADPYHVVKLWLCSAGLLALSVILQLHSKKLEALDKSVLALVAVYAVCAAASSDRITSFLGYQGFYFYGLFTVLLACAAYFIARLGDWDIEDFISGLLIAAAISSVYGILQHMGYELFPDVASDRIAATHRAISTCGSPVFWSSVLAVAMPLAAGRIAWRGVLGVTILAALIAGIFSTETRSAMMAGTLATGIVYWGRMSRESRLLLVSGSFMAIVTVWAMRPGDLLCSDSGRIEAWRVALRQFAETPIFGRGPDTFASAWQQFRPLSGGSIGLWTQHQAAHNDAMQILATCGIAGLLAYVVLACNVLRTMRGNRPDLVGAILAYGIMSMMSPMPFYTLILVAMISGYLARNQTRTESVSDRPWNPGNSIPQVTLNV